MMLSVTREGSKLCQRQAVTKQNQDAEEREPSVNTSCHIDYLLKHSFIKQKEGVTGNVSVKQQLQSLPFSTKYTQVTFINKTNFQCCHKHKEQQKFSFLIFTWDSPQHEELTS